LEDEKRETPITRRETPAICDARFAMRARVGPIFSADAQNDNVAIEGSERANDGFRRLAEKFIQLFDIAGRRFSGVMLPFVALNSFEAAVIGCLQNRRVRLYLNHRGMVFRLCLRFSDFFQRSRFLGRPFEWVYNLPRGIRQPCACAL